MKKKRILLILVNISLILCLGAIDANANGGPVAWTGVTPVGAVGLVQDSDISLRSEDLHITLTDFNTYRVRAEYDLQNEGPNKTVLFGVPITWTEGMTAEGTEINKGAAKKASKVAEKISIALNGQAIQCKLNPSDTISLKDSVLLKGPEDADYKVNTWCVANLSFAAKTNAKLVLEYTAELFYEDMVFTKSALTEFGERKLLYLFYPAGFWKGPVSTVYINVDMGPYSSFKSIQGPPDQKVTGHTIAWALKDVDFKTLPKLEISFPTELLSKKQLVTWNRTAGKNEKIAMKVKASSTLPDEGNVTYKPDNLLDGKGETAWCKSGSGNGVGEWLQFNLKGTKPGNYCRIEGIAFTPGYVKNQRSYLENGRVRKVRITDCEGNRPYDFTIQSDKEYDMSAVLLRMPVDVDKSGILGTRTRISYPLEYIEQTSCFKLQILEVENGTTDDMCISEVALVLNCG